MQSELVFSWLVIHGLHLISATQLSDFPACGFRNEPGSPGQVYKWDECLWDCTWVPNPFYRRNWTVNLVDEYLRNPETPDEEVVFNDVTYFMTTPKIPKDLTCLSGCRIREIVSFKPKSRMCLQFFFCSAVKQISNRLQEDVQGFLQLLPQPPQKKLQTGNTKEEGKMLTKLKKGNEIHS